jgi:hypothetical protein
MRPYVAGLCSRWLWRRVDGQVDRRDKYGSLVEEVLNAYVSR